MILLETTDRETISCRRGGTRATPRAVSTIRAESRVAFVGVAANNEPRVNHRHRAVENIANPRRSLGGVQSTSGLSDLAVNDSRNSGDESTARPLFHRHRDERGTLISRFTLYEKDKTRQISAVARPLRRCKMAFASELRRSMEIDDADEATKKRARTRRGRRGGG